MVAPVADALKFEHQYTSGVIAWAPEDRLTDAPIEAVSGQVREDRLGRTQPDRYAGGHRAEVLAHLVRMRGRRRPDGW